MVNRANAKVTYFVTGYFQGPNTAGATTAAGVYREDIVVHRHAQPPLHVEQPTLDGGSNSLGVGPPLGKEADGYKGFFGSLFDYSFSSFVTPRIIKILYVLATILISLWTLFLARRRVQRVRRCRRP